MLFAAVHESAPGANAKCRHDSRTSAIGGKAEEICSGWVLLILARTGHRSHSANWYPTIRWRCL